jgi:hypothetical protein
MSCQSPKNLVDLIKDSNRRTFFLVVAWFFSHTAAAYAILRQNGADVGKMEFRVLLI